MLVLAARQQDRAAEVSPHDTSVALEAVRRHLEVAYLIDGPEAASANRAALDRLAPLLLPPAVHGADEFHAVALYLAAFNLADSPAEEQAYLQQSLALMLRLQDQGRGPSPYRRTVDVARALCEALPPTDASALAHPCFPALTP